MIFLHVKDCALVTCQMCHMSNVSHVKCVTCQMCHMSNYHNFPLKCMLYLSL